MPNVLTTDTLVVAFDYADAIWMRSYSHLMSAVIEFTLAYDWRENFDGTAYIFYPRLAPPPFDGKTLSAAENDASNSGVKTADLIAFLHLIHWNLIEQDRMKSSLAHLKKVAELSRDTLKAVLAEPDDDREWIARPRQKNGAVKALALGALSQEQIDAKLSAVDDFEALLDGRILFPSERFEGGFNVRRIFEEPHRFDLILWFIGLDAAPYIEKGEVLSPERWKELWRLFNDSFFRHFRWFN